MELTSYTYPTENTSSPSILCPTAVTFYVLPFAYAFLFLTALPGNALSLWVFLKRISTVSPTHIYLSHLSISNLLLSVTTPFLAAYYALGSTWRLNSTLCQLVLHGITPVQHINIYISLLILTWVALSRFAALIQHTHASRPSTCTTLLPHAFFNRLTKASFATTVCITVWVVAVVAIVPVTVYYSVREVMGSNDAAIGEDGEAEGGGSGELCYNPEAEIGGSLSRTLSVPVITLFFVFYLLVLLSYITVLRHIRRSRRSTTVITSQTLLGRVFRNIVVIQLVLSVCLLPYHIFKPIFISVAHSQHEPTNSPENPCHPLSTFIEVKNCLYLLAALRGSTDPVMYFLLDNTFRQQILRLLGCNQDKSRERPMFGSVTEGAIEKTGQLVDGNLVTVTSSQGV